MFADRLFCVIDLDANGIIEEDEFVNTFYRIYCSEIEDHFRLAFSSKCSMPDPSVYDFDNDNLITQDEVRLLLSYAPLEQSSVCYAS